MIPPRPSSISTPVDHHDGNRVAKTVGGVTTKYRVENLNPTRYSQVIEEVAAGAVRRRFLSRDPEDGTPMEPVTLHRYLYAGGDPVGKVDPTGRVSTEYVEISTGLSLGEMAYALDYGAGTVVRYAAIAKVPCYLAALFVRALKDYGKEIEMPSWADHLCLLPGP